MAQEGHERPKVTALICCSRRRVGAIFRSPVPISAAPISRERSQSRAVRLTNGPVVTRVAAATTGATKSRGREISRQRISGRLV